MSFSTALHLVVVTALLSASCWSDRGDTKSVTVFAASSLTEAMQSLEKHYESEHRGTDIELAFAGSQALRLQIENGAKADVFASANEAHWNTLVESGQAHGAPAAFARNELVMVVRSGESTIDSIESLGPNHKIVVGAAAVPAGQYARQVFERAREEFGDEFADRMQSAVVSEEANVRLVRAKVALGEADAALVYRSDANVDERVSVVPLPEPLRVEATYFIGTTSAAPEALDFVEFVRSEQGQSLLAGHGFGSVGR